MLKLAIILAALSCCYGQVQNRYYLYTARNVARDLRIDLTSTDLPEGLKENEGVTILIHGHEGAYDSDFNTAVSRRLLEKNIPNIIALDWQVRASNSYSIARGHVREVAKELKDFIDWLTNLQSTGSEPTNLIKATDIHLIGFNLGAHVAGMASRDVTGEIGRITGLDPSGSGWGKNSGRLDKTDANYVEVIHTDGTGLLANGIGTNIGDIDFFVNGGSNQPGCVSHSCSHERAWRVYEASVHHENNDNINLEASACNSMTQVNLNTCRGTTLPIGGTVMDKKGASSHTLFRINTRRSYPFFS
ncbi:hypothetical protein PYW08_002087 [Mythimna loreyi]|uniref:Uncharacterized protein n=1 Tax=Mythimna loreyi TaxID=667449 RepID=A0ACC2R1Z7_9NEOP|nr:hypothetical protein PYW08_002087 [Mythimna loreyi]